MSNIKRVITLEPYDPARHRLLGLLTDIREYPHKLNVGDSVESAVREILKSPFFVLRDKDNEAWGCVALRVHERYVYTSDNGAQTLRNVAEIDSIFVREKYRGRGLSRFMIERMMFNVHAMGVNGVVIEITADDTALTIGQPLPYLMRMHDDCQAMGFTTIGLVCSDNGELLYMSSPEINQYMEQVCGL